LAWDRAGSHPPVMQMDGWRIENLGRVARHGAGIRNVGGYFAYWRAASRRALELGADIIHCHNLDTVPAALRTLRRSTTRPYWVLDFYEIYRESRALPQRGLAGLVARAAARYLERRSIPTADVVITVLEGQVYYYEDLGARRVVVVENAPDPDRYRVVERDEADFVISFIGQKRWVPSLAHLMQAIQPHPEMRALLVGGGPAEEEIARLAAGMERGEVAGRVEPGEIPALYHSCDAVYACYDISLLNWRTSLPVKAMEGMACGLPVIVSKGSWMGEYVERHGIGVAVDDRDPADVEAGLVRLASDREAAREMGRRGREIVERDLNWSAAAGRLRQAYPSVGKRSVDSVD
ncbi:MAG: glycosyltransferase, partial [Actinomycetota bacterium]|nr:glycosyltransferase [Actinomycetota bacterium]